MKFNKYIFFSLIMLCFSLCQAMNPRNPRKRASKKQSYHTQMMKSFCFKDYYKESVSTPKESLQPSVKQNCVYRPNAGGWIAYEHHACLFDFVLPGPVAEFKPPRKQKAVKSKALPQLPLQHQAIILPQIAEKSVTVVPTVTLNPFAVFQAQINNQDNVKHMLECSASESEGEWQEIMQLGDFPLGGF